jgi:molybdopterin-guanine dinucleotide biosynthesis protein A
MTNIPCVIFAGGKSSRMGEDKSLLPFGSSSTLTEFQIQKFQNNFKNIYISCKNRDKFSFNASFIEDLKEYEDSAPHIGLISVFEHLSDKYIFALSVDAPFFKYSHFQTLYKNLNNKTQAVIAKSPNGNQPLCAIYKKDILPTLKSLVAKKKYRFSHLFENIVVKFVEFENEEIFTNLNFQEDYRKAKEKEKIK